MDMKRFKIDELERVRERQLEYRRSLEKRGLPMCEEIFKNLVSSLDPDIYKNNSSLDLNSEKLERDLTIIEEMASHAASFWIVNKVD